MKAWITKNFSEEDGPPAADGKSVTIKATRDEVRAIADFLQDVVAHLQTANYCHMHFRDWFPSWDKRRHIDIQITVDERAA